ncbi:MAG: DNA recombination protein RmuC [Gammaproteobacteria bacterium]|nr:DNA recombination protein RmuC [Gammaproteobacteria bacterium]
MSEMLRWMTLLAAALGAVLALVAVIRSRSGLDGIDRAVREELRAGRDESRGAAQGLREEIAGSLKGMNDTIVATISAMATAQQTELGNMARQLREMTESSRVAMDQVRAVLDARVKELQEGNEKKLEEMRKTVDEKLHETLEKRLGESFKLVSDRLEAVHKGLGEMQSLATGVGDLKRVLTNVKARGTWAEVQLGAVLEQVLTVDQFARNVAVKPGSTERVEYAVRLPGSKGEPDSHVWLPIDSKFPQEDYLRLQDAADKADANSVQAAADALARRVRAEAKDINDKYVCPPHTTDFAIMFLATEGLYAEVLRQPALVDDLQQLYRVVVAGPTTLTAVLSSLRMGFQTLAIEQRASDVWRVLGAVKTEFGKFGGVLEKVKKQLSAASRSLDETGVRTRALERQLRVVEQLPATEASRVLDRSEFAGDDGREPPAADAPIEDDE